MPNTILFICNCCGRIARSQEQHTIPGRAPLTQVECITPNCKNNHWTYSWRAGDDESSAQVLDRYTPIEMTDEQAARWIAAQGEPNG